MDFAELAPKHNYASGEAIKVDESRLRLLIERGEEALGLERKGRDFGLLYLPDNIIARMGVNAAYSAEENKFATPRNQHEATLFHEGIHYLMHQEGLLFGPSLQRATFYDRLIDETVAEFTASGVYGYNEFANDLMGFYERLKEGNPEALDTLVNQLRGLPKEMIPLIKSAVSTMDFPQLEIAERQRAIETEYKETKDFDTIKRDVSSLYEFMGSLSGLFTMASVSEAVKMLAVGNAIGLRNCGVKPKDLVSWLREGVANGWDSYGLYFYDIIGASSA